MLGRQPDRQLPVRAGGAAATCSTRAAGRIVNIASTAGQRGYAYVAAYAAAKHGVIGLTRSLALEVAKKGVTVNAVCPGYTETDILRESIANVVAKTGRSEAEARAEFAAGNPQGRIVQPERGGRRGALAVRRRRRGGHRAGDLGLRRGGDVTQHERSPSHRAAARRAGARPRGARRRGDHAALKLWLRLLACTTQIETEIRAPPARAVRHHAGALRLHGAALPLPGRPEDARAVALPDGDRRQRDRPHRRARARRPGGARGRARRPARLDPCASRRKGRRGFEAMAQEHERWIVELLGGLDERTCSSSTPSSARCACSWCAPRTSTRSDSETSPTRHASRAAEEPTPHADRRARRPRRSAARQPQARGRLPRDAFPLAGERRAWPPSR